jgi:hypothetical protein
MSEIPQFWGDLPISVEISLKRHSKKMPRLDGALISIDGIKSIPTILRPRRTTKATVELKGPLCLCLYKLPVVGSIT